MAQYRLSSAVALVINEFRVLLARLRRRTGWLPLKHGMHAVLRLRHLAATVAARPRPSSAAAMPTQDELKKQVGYKAVDDYVRSGMKIGLGTGSTAYFAVERVGELLASGKLQDIVAVRPSPSAAAPRPLG